MTHKPLTDHDMALIAVLCQDGEARCGTRAADARKRGDHDAEKVAAAEMMRYRSLRSKMFSPD